MRPTAEIIADIDATTQKLAFVNGGLERLSPLVRQSRAGGKYGGDRDELVAKLKALRAELLAAGWDELHQRRAEGVKTEGGARDC